MKILITGSAGFIGFHLAERLAANHSLVGLDNINDYYETSLKYGRLSHSGFEKERITENRLVKSARHSDYRFIMADLADKATIIKLFEEEQFDLVIHLAAQAGVRYSIDHPDAYLQSNLTGFHNIVEACRHSDTGRLIFASSSSVYGNTKETPFRETQPVDHPISLYAATKKSNELVAHVYSHLYGIKMTGLRFFTVYGEWGRPDMAYFKFVRKILNGAPIEVYNNGDLERDFTFIRDIVDGIEKMVNHPTDELYKIYNIGNSRPLNLLSFIETIESELGKKARKVMKPMQPGDVYTTYADTSRLEKDYGYKPSTDFREGVRKFIKWYKTFYGVE